MSITTLLAISLGAILTNNFIFAQFLGCCPFLGVSKKIDTAVGMGAAVTFVMGLASAFCYLVNLILIPLHLEFMQTVAFILVIAGLVQFVEMFLKKNIPTLYTALGVYLPLITTNCAVLGVALLNVQNDYNFIGSVVYGITGGLGFLLAIFLFAAVREQLEVSSDSPKSFEGFPIALVNLRQYGMVKVRKTAEDGLVEGLIFRLTGISEYGERVDMAVATNAAGTAVFERVPIGTDYTLSEENTPERYVIPEVQNISVEWNRVTERRFDNILKKWHADVRKRGDILQGAGPAGPAGCAAADPPGRSGRDGPGHGHYQQGV